MPVKSINLYTSKQWRAWRNAKRAAEDELDEETPTEGQLLEEIARAYTGRP